MKLAVLSDLHAAPRGSDASGTEVKLFSDAGSYPIHEHPLSSLRDLIQKSSLKADVIICPGDMTNRANPQALIYVWEQLHDLVGTLQAQGLIATVGNHDVDSREHGVDAFPRENLMKLSPRFPLANDALADHYWAHGYYLTELAGIRFLVVNSCWLHESRDDLDRGAVTGYTLETIRRDLEAASTKPAINVAVCHHHPHPHSELGLGADDVMRNGQQLLGLLSEHGSWLVVHGHKHHPKVEYAQGQVYQPVIFASGSFSGRLEGLNASVSRNYFHLVELSVPATSVKGRVLSWAWAPGLGWRQYVDNDWRFPCEFGFGYQSDIAELARQVHTQLMGKSLMRWDELCRRIGDISFLMPKQMKALIDEVRSVHRLNVHFDDLGRPVQIGPPL